MGKRLERFGEVGIIDETNGFRLDFADEGLGRLLDLGAIIRVLKELICFVVVINKSA